MSQRCFAVSSVSTRPMPIITTLPFPDSSSMSGQERDGRQLHQPARSQQADTEYPVYGRFGVVKKELRGVVIKE